MKPIHALAAFSFFGILGGVIFADRVEPFVFGMPLLFFWIVAWAVLTSATMAVVYLLDPANKVDETE